jgi:hypothetical protein
LASVDKGVIYHQDSSREKTMIRTERKSQPLLIAASWMIVLIPLAWGVVQSVVKSLPLFQMPTAAALPSSSAPGTSSSGPAAERP